MTFFLAWVAVGAVLTLTWVGVCEMARKTNDRAGVEPDAVNEPSTTKESA